MTAMRQLGVGSPKAVPKLLPPSTSSRRNPERAASQDLSQREKNFSMIEWQAARRAASRFYPKHTAAAGWKHRALSNVEQEEVSQMPKDRGAEQ